MMQLKPVTSHAGTLLGWVYASDNEMEQLMREVLLKETLAQISRAKRLKQRPPVSAEPIPRWNISDRH